MFTVANSGEFDSGNLDYLTDTFGAAGNRKTWGFSCWVKIANIGTQYTLLGAGNNTTDHDQITINDDGRLLINSTVGNTQQFVISTKREVVDSGKWVHIYVAYDSTQATDTDRYNVYVSGYRITDFNLVSYPKHCALSSLFL